jgi:hypothetical protein
MIKGVVRVYATFRIAATPAVSATCGYLSVIGMGRPIGQ